MGIISLHTHTPYIQENKMPTKPLQGLNFGVSTYETKAGEIDLTVVAVKSNAGETNYSYKLQSFQADFYSLVGVKDGSNSWLIGCSSPGNLGIAFDIEFKEKKGEKWENDKIKADAAVIAWYGIPGKLTQPTCILANGIESMEVLVEVSTTFNCVLVDMTLQINRQHHIVFKNFELKTQISEALHKLCQMWIDGSKINPIEPYEAEGFEEINELATFLGEHGMFYVPVVDPANVASLQYVYGSPIPGKGKIGYNLPPLKSAATCPHEGLSIALPEIKTKGGSWGGSKGETTVEKIAARQKFLMGEFKLENDVDLQDLYLTVNSDDSNQKYFAFLINIMGA
jgi:hypothetical protein